MQWKCSSSMSGANWTARLLAILMLSAWCHGSLAAEPALPVDAEHAAEMKAGLELFKNGVRATLTSRCLICHGGDHTEGNFDLSTRERLLLGSDSGDAIVPGEPDESRLLELIRHEDEPRMPAEASKMPEAEIESIKQWIALGAPYDKPLVDEDGPKVQWTEREIRPEDKQWWAFLPLQQVEPPTIADGQDWVRNDVDRFVLDKLTDKKLTPNQPAQRRKLIRRVYLDLIGLPPTPEQVEAFVDDSSPGAYAKVVDELLASPRYGERWARHWLDVARFAESDGFEHDYDRPHAYHYRDFVIHALNSDMPFDQFLQWQLAGDELAPDDPWAMKATGFLAAGVFPTQITANEVERTRYDALDDMVSTTSSAMLGLTVGCARCHDHKFDPFPQADYQRMLATFTTTVRAEIDIQVGAANSEEQQRYEDEQRSLVEALERYEQDQLPAALAKWEASRENSAPVWRGVDLVSYKSEGSATLTKLEDGSILASGKNPDHDVYQFVAETDVEAISGLRLDTLPHASFVRGGPGRAFNGNFCLTDLQVVASPLNGEGKPKTVAFSRAKATYDRKGHESAVAIDGNATSGGYALDPHFGQPHYALYEASENFGFKGGTRLEIKMIFRCNTGHNIGRCNFAVTESPRPIPLMEQAALPEQVAAALKVPAAERSVEQSQQLLNWFKMQDSDWIALNKAIADHQASRPKQRVEKVQVASEGVPARRKHTQGVDFFPETYFLVRGDSDQKDGVATQSFLQVLMPSADAASRWQETPPPGSKLSYRRRSMANWITDTDHGAGQLAARVAVNRLWQHHFGRGIVATPNDFGRQGPPPTHPELLDWLARQLIDGGWRLKPMHKLLVTSGAYMQSSEMDEADFKLDPENEFLWRFEPRRAEAEVIRDAMLAVSGQLDTTLYGPGTLNESMKRRSIYFMVKRSKLVPFLQLFDWPEPISSLGRRPSTTVAPQALLFMNNPQVRGYAQALAGRIDAGVPALEETIATGYRHTLGRQPTQQEATEALAFIEQQQAAYQAENKPNARALAVADFAQVLLSLNEFIYID